MIKHFYNKTVFGKTSFMIKHYDGTSVQCDSTKQLIKQPVIHSYPHQKHVLGMYNNLLGPTVLIQM